LKTQDLQRGHLTFQNSKEADFALNQVNSIAMSAIQNTGNFGGAHLLVSFDDESNNYILPILTAPMEKTRATQLIINLIAEKQKPDCILLVSASSPFEKGDMHNSVIAHFETRENPNRTIDILGRCANPNKLTFLDDEGYHQITQGEPYRAFPLYGFYHSTEESISGSSKKQILKQVNKLLEMTEKCKNHTYQQFIESGSEEMKALYKITMLSYLS